MILRELSRPSAIIISAVSLAILAGIGCSGGGGTTTPPPQSNNEWTWMAGSNTWNAPGLYGTKGVGSANNIPGARELSPSWTDSSGDFWLFGGALATSGIASSGNDLWKYDLPTQEWTWEGGSSVPNQPGVYGTQGTPSSSNIPGGREAATSWTDASGNFWLFGGIAYDSVGASDADINDLWEFDPGSGAWTWVSGSEVNAYTMPLPGVYGTQGVPSASNVPGARDGASGWADSSGNLWLFGGGGFDSSGAPGLLNDLWKFSPSAHTWTWISGSNMAGASGVYGTQGTPSAANVPGARERATGLIDNNGNLWLFGGIAVNSTEAGMLNDLWEYNPATKMWTWVSGSSDFDAVGVYGTEGAPAASNVPGARERAMGWNDKSGNLWFYGGVMNGGPDFSDLWEYSPTTNMWTWMSGSMTPNMAGVYGQQGTPSASNLPGAREEAGAWTDNAGDLWLFGGLQNDSQGDGLCNDLWRYQP